MKKRVKDQWDAPSESKPDKTYKVTNYENGTWACGCPRWIFHREECKHIQSAQNGEYDGMEIPKYQITQASVRQTILHDEKTIYVPLIPFNEHGTQFAITIAHDLLTIGVPFRQVKEHFKHVFSKMPSRKDITSIITARGRCIHDKWVDKQGWTGYVYIRL